MSVAGGWAGGQDMNMVGGWVGHEQVRGTMQFHMLGL